MAFVMRNQQQSMLCRIRELNLVARFKQSDFSGGDCIESTPMQPDNESFADAFVQVDGGPRHQSSSSSFSAI